MELAVCKKEAEKLIKEHCPTYSLKFDRAVRRFGCCNYTRKTISLSSKLTELNDWKTVRLTVLHEIAHAIVGHKHGHDYVWQSKCIEIGGDGQRCYDSIKVNTPTLPFVAICPQCGHEHSKSRMPKRRHACAVCKTGSFEDRELFFKRRDKQKIAANAPKKTEQVFKVEKNGQFSFF